ncbi:hypothetical protein GCM10009771_13040 [Nesterenkonia flava]
MPAILRVIREGHTYEREVSDEGWLTISVLLRVNGWHGRSLWLRFAPDQIDQSPGPHDEVMIEVLPEAQVVEFDTNETPDFDHGAHALWSRVEPLLLEARAAIVLTVGPDGHVNLG